MPRYPLSDEEYAEELDACAEEDWRNEGWDGYATPEDDNE